MRGWVCGGGLGRGDEDLPAHQGDGDEEDCKETHCEGRDGLYLSWFGYVRSLEVWLRMDGLKVERIGKRKSRRVEDIGERSDRSGSRVNKLPMISEFTCVNV